MTLVEHLRQVLARRLDEDTQALGAFAAGAEQRVLATELPIHRGGSLEVALSLAPAQVVGS